MRIRMRIRNITSSFKDKKSKRSYKTVESKVFLTIFAWWWKDPESVLVSCDQRIRYESGRLKNIRILHWFSNYLNTWGRGEGRWGRMYRPGRWPGPPGSAACCSCSLGRLPGRYAPIFPRPPHSAGRPGEILLYWNMRGKFRETVFWKFTKTCDLSLPEYSTAFPACRIFEFSFSHEFQEAGQLPARVHLLMREF
jgi:hypothetical protein